MTIQTFTPEPRLPATPGNGDDYADQVDRFIPGTPYRIGCAVGRLRPLGAQSCSPEPLLFRPGWVTPHRPYKDREPVCEQHSKPTAARCLELAEDCERKAQDCDQRAGLMASNADRSRQIDAAMWLRRRAAHYRNALHEGRTMDVVEPAIALAAD